MAAWYWFKNGAETEASWRSSVPVSLSIKNVPDELAERLRKRARRHHRSRQGELMAILVNVTGPASLSLDEAEQRLRALGFSTGDDSATWVRELRDGR